eukprot:CAMPEP_0176276688 /NCGR_PEP_ID=MMETSP0121_2-20121125/47886_1 /TAXON_ID=160619 /ORGANISM="Kryptoperidinium foliaceum, Strain CCMP 1326" /LENGTH=283 /DNA_ID=CAMNT_0017616955 /DNA_START=107 /DNA_END=958 /DNA_ORIENTATION=+
MQLLCKATEHPYAGLSIAARKASLTSDLRRQLTRLDNTAAMIRHITRPHIEQMLQELCQQLPPDLTTAMSCPCSSHSAVREIRADAADMETRLAQHVCNAEERMNTLESRLTGRFGDVEYRIQTGLVDLELREKASLASVAELAAQLERQGEHRGRRDENLIAQLDGLAEQVRQYTESRAHPDVRRHEDENNERSRAPQGEQRPHSDAFGPNVSPESSRSSRESASSSEGDRARQVLMLRGWMDPAWHQTPNAHRAPEHVRGPQKPRYPCMAAGRRWRESSIG